MTVVVGSNEGPALLANAAEHWDDRGFDIDRSSEKRFHPSVSAAQDGFLVRAMFVPQKESGAKFFIGGSSPCVKRPKHGPLGEGKTVALGGDVVRDLAFSPERERLAYLGGGLSLDPHVSVIEQGRPRRVTPPDVDVTSFTWMPDSRSVLVAARIGDHDELVVYDLRRKLLRRIPMVRPLRTDGGMAAAETGLHTVEVTVVASAAPPGSGEAILDLVRIDVATGRVGPITATPEESESDPGFVDSQRVVYSSGRNVGIGQGASGRIGVITIDGTAPRWVTSDDVIAGDPTVTADHTQVLFDGTTVGRQDRGVWMVFVDVGVPVRRVHDGPTPAVLDPTREWLLVTAPPGLRLVAVDLD